MGATKTLIQHILPAGIVESLSPKWHVLEATTLHTVHGFPARSLNVIGVAGANGKTTAHLIHSILYEAGYKVGLISSVSWGAGIELYTEQSHPSHATVKNYIQRIKHLKSEGVEWVVLETKPHDISPYTFYGTDFHVAAMTNSTLSNNSHSLEDHVQEGLMLLEQTQLNKNGLQIGVIDADDPYAAHFSNTIEKSISYSQSHGDLTAQHVRIRPAGSQFAIKVGDRLLQNKHSKKSKKQSLTDEYLINCRLPGRVNVSNVLAAVGICRMLGVKRTQIEQGIASVKVVPGERTAIDEGQLFDVIIDDARTPDTFDKLFSEIKPLVTGSLLVMFGSVGGREHSKRAILGKIAAEYADIVVITEENNYQESPSKIRNEVAAGAVAAGKRKEKDLFLVKNREEAIKFVISKAKAGDTVLLLGKGHARTMAHKHGIDPWDEVSATRRNIAIRLT